MPLNCLLIDLGSLRGVLCDTGGLDAVTGAGVGCEEKLVSVDMPLDA